MKAFAYIFAFGMVVLFPGLTEDCVLSKRLKRRP